MSYVEAMTVSATVCWKALLALLLVRKSALVLSLRSVGRSRLHQLAEFLPRYGAGSPRLPT
jgi:hypothetical protein